MLLKPEAGTLTQAIAGVTNDMLTELSANRDDIKPDEAIKLFTTNPVLSICADTYILLGVGRFGDYHHEDEDKAKWVRSNLETMRGSWKRCIAEQFTAGLIGNAVSEWSVDDGSEARKRDKGADKKGARKRGDRSTNGKEWRLDSIHALHPSSYQFQIKNRELIGIKDSSGWEDVQVPMERLIHGCNKQYLTYGDPSKATGIAKIVKPLYDAWRILMSEMLVAGQRQATPILVGYGDSECDIELLDEQGNPIFDKDGQVVTVPASKQLLDDLLDIDNRSVLSTDIRNRIESVANQSSGAFFFEAIKMIQNLMFLSFGFPETIFQTGQGNGLGNSGLNQGHLWIVQNNIDAIASQIREEILEKPIRHLLYWNFGEQESFGQFIQPEEDTTDKVQLISALGGLASNGVLSVQDLSVINRIRGLAGLEAVDKIEGGMTQFSKDYWS